MKTSSSLTVVFSFICYFFIRLFSGRVKGCEIGLYIFAWWVWHVLQLTKFQFKFAGFVKVFRKFFLNYCVLNSPKGGCREKNFVRITEPSVESVGHRVILRNILLPQLWSLICLSVYENIPKESTVPKKLTKAVKFSFYKEKVGIKITVTLKRLFENWRLNSCAGPITPCRNRPLIYNLCVCVWMCAWVCACTRNIY